MAPIFFVNTSDFRKWLEEHHQTGTELLVGYYKVETKKPTMTWSDSVDEALCFGWIDGIRKSIDSESYCIRFTPRKSKSNWSAVNIKKVEELVGKGRMTPAGLAAYEKRSEARSEIYSYENRPERLSPELQTRIQQHPQAWSFFSSQSASYQKTNIYWVMSAKQDTTRMNRLIKLIEASEACKRLF